MKTTIDAMKYALDIISRTTSSAFVKTMLEEAIAREEAQTVEPVAHLKFWAYQQVSQDGNVNADEGLEVAKAGEIGMDGVAAFPVFTHPSPAQVTCQIYGHVVGACGECNTHEEAQMAEPVGIVDEGDYGLFVNLETANGVMVKRGDKLFTHPAPATEPTQVTCQLYGHVVGVCGECNTHTEPAKLPENCGTGYCSCVECVKPAKPSVGERASHINALRESARMLETGCEKGWLVDELDKAADMLAADALEIEQTCNCRFVGEINTVQCTLHNAWAETLNEQSGYRKELHTLKAQQVVVPQDKQCDLSYVHGLQRGHTLGHMGLDEQYAIEMNAYRREIAAAPQPPQANAQKSGDAHEIWATAQLAPGEGIEDGVARVEALLGAQRVPMTDDEIRQCRLETEYDGTPSEPLIHRSTHSRFMAFARAVEQFHGIGVKS